MKHAARPSRMFAPIFTVVCLVTGCAQQPVEPPPRTISAIEVGPADETIPATSSMSYTATATYSDGTTEDKTSAVTWSSSDAAVATIDGATGEATGVNDGTATIEASLDGVTGSTSLTVVSIEALAVTPAALRLLVGGSGQLQATGTTKKGASFDATDFVTWTSDDATVAAVSGASPNRGAVSGVGDGTVAVTASIAALSANAMVTVASLTSLTVNPATSTASVGGTQQFTAFGNYSDGVNQDLTASATWASNDGAIASISTQGLATALAEGTATLTASIDPAVLASGMSQRVAGASVANASNATVTGSAVLNVVSAGASSIVDVYVGSNSGVSHFIVDAQAQTVTAGRVSGTGIPPQSLVYDPNTRQLIAGRRGAGADAAVFGRDPATGELASVVGSPAKLAGGALGAMAFDPDMNLLAVGTGISPSTVSWYEWSPVAPFVQGVAGPIDNETVIAADLQVAEGQNGENVWYVLDSGAKLRAFSAGPGPAPATYSSHAVGSGPTFQERWPNAVLAGQYAVWMAVSAYTAAGLQCVAHGGFDGWGTLSFGWLSGFALARAPVKDREATAGVFLSVGQQVGLYMLFAGGFLGWGQVPANCDVSLDPTAEVATQRDTPFALRATEVPGGGAVVSVLSFNSADDPATVKDQMETYVVGPLGTPVLIDAREVGNYATDNLMVGRSQVLLPTASTTQEQ